MTELNHVYEASSSDWQTTSTSWTDINAGINLDGSNLSDSTEYLLLFAHFINGSDATKNEYETRIETGGLEISGSDLSFHKQEPRRTSTIYGHPYFYMQRHTTPASAINIDQQFRATAGSTCSVREPWAVALKIGNDADALNENLDIFWDEDTTDYTSLDDSGWTDGPSVTVGNGSDDYLFFAHIKVRVNSTSASIRYRLNGASYPTGDYVELEGEDTDEEWSIGLAWTQGGFANQAVTLQFQTDDSTAGAMDVLNSRIVAIRLNRFENHDIANNGVTTQFAVQGTWYALHANQGFTNVASERQLMALGSLIYKSGDTNKTIQTRVQDDGTMSIIGAFADWGICVQNGTTDQVPMFSLGKETMSASYDLSVDMDARDQNSDVSPAAERVHSCMALFVTELGEPLEVCDQDIIPTAIEAQTYLSGTINDIDEGVDSPDANWLTLNAP